MASLLPFPVKMSMLADPKRKVKYSVNPRGNAWSNDENKFGQKLLEKFGWSKGKGLGAKEDGKVDHVKVAVKNDTRGVGASKEYVDNWIAHQDDFNALLANLNQTGDNKEAEECEGKSVIKLESKSQKSRSRVHYHKFTKGKDLSSRSSEDLNCIFGKRENIPVKETTDEKAESHETADESSSSTKPVDGGLVTYTSSEGIQDYFARRMAEKRLKCNLSSSSLNSAEVRDQSDTSEIKKDLFNQMSFSYNDPECEEDKNIVEGKRVSFFIPEDGTENNTDSSADQPSSQEIQGSKRGKFHKKKKKTKKADVEDISEKCAIDISNESDKLTLKTKKKKRKSKMSDDEENERENCPTSDFDQQEPDHKKKKKDKTSDELNDCNRCSLSEATTLLVVDHSMSNDVSAKSEKVKKKRKKYDKKEQLTDGQKHEKNGISLISSSNSECPVDSCGIKRKRKRKTSGEDSAKNCQLFNSDFALDADESSVKKIDSKFESIVENIDFSPNKQSNNSVMEQNKISREKKKKKRPKKKKVKVSKSDIVCKQFNQKVHKSFQGGNLVQVSGYAMTSEEKSQSLARKMENSQSLRFK